MKRQRVAFVVSHPIQYYAPLHQQLSRREELEIRVFFTWHSGASKVFDRGFGSGFSWDLPLTDGYSFELVPNTSADPGTHHFSGLRNPDLVERVRAFRPDAVHVTGWAWRSHLLLLRGLHRARIPTLFRGDSHRLDPSPRGPREWLKRLLLRRIYSWPVACLYVGAANRAYFESYGVPADRLAHCPHSIDVARFAEHAEDREREAASWRGELGLTDADPVLLFAGKFEKKKRPVEMMRAMLEHGDPRIVVILVGGGELEGEVAAVAGSAPGRFRILPFQNQSRMPLVYRLGNLFVLPSAWGETWGMAVNEALACGRQVLVSDRVGCAADVVEPTSGQVFPWRSWRAMTQAAGHMIFDPTAKSEQRAAATRQAWRFDLAQTEAALLEAIGQVCKP